MTTRADGRGQTITIGIELITETCYSCGVLFALPKDLREKLLEQRERMTFYCPNGHGQSYLGKSLKDQLKEVERQRDRAWEAEAEQRRRVQAEQRVTAAYKGQVTKLRKRAVAGTCPFGCRRHFVDLERHVASKHAGAELPK